MFRPTTILSRCLALFSLALFSLVLAACATPDPAPRYADITFQGKPKIGLDVGSIEVVNEYREPLSRPHVEHLVPVNPGRTVERWASDRLTASGSQFNRAVLRVKEASIVEEKLKTTTGLRGSLTNAQSERYTAERPGTHLVRADRDHPARSGHDADPQRRNPSRPLPALEMGGKVHPLMQDTNDL